ncbi:hypothetical protein AALA90_01875 [Lachnospiraceae bacterium 38-10]|jgi:hypothetical protein|nr:MULTISPECIES: hypothetical protein [Lachnospiraceae]
MDYKKIYNSLETNADRITFLKSLLSSQESPVGDWKVMKIYEARLTEATDPYGVDELMQNRQLIRDKINELQEAEETE